MALGGAGGEAVTGAGAGDELPPKHGSAARSSGAPLRTDARRCRGRKGWCRPSPGLNGERVARQPRARACLPEAPQSDTLRKALGALRTSEAPARTASLERTLTKIGGWLDEGMAGQVGVVEW